MVALVLCSFSFAFLQAFVDFACWALIGFMCSMLRALIRCIKVLKRLTNLLECINVSLLYSDIYSIIWQWLLYNKLTFIHSSKFVSLFKNFMCLCITFLTIISQKAAIPLSNFSIQKEFQTNQSANRRQNNTLLQHTLCNTIMLNEGKLNSKAFQTKILLLSHVIQGRHEHSLFSRVLDAY